MKILITGSSSGIGRDMARYLSSKENELILVSSNKDKLESVSKALINSSVYVCDLSNNDNVNKLCEYILKEKPDFVINNAGFGAFGFYDEISLDREIEMINVNIVALHKITKTCLEYMDNGHILNVSSSAGLMPGGPMLNTYYATKNYVRSYSLGLYKELKKKNKNIHISILCPGPVNTNFNKVADVQFALKGLSSDYVAEYAIKKLFKGKFYIVPGWKIRLARFGAKIAPNNLTAKICYNMQRRKI